MLKKYVIKRIRQKANVWISDLSLKSHSCTLNLQEAKHSNHRKSANQALYKSYLHQFRDQPWYDFKVVEISQVQSGYVSKINGRRFIAFDGAVACKHLKITLDQPPCVFCYNFGNWESSEHISRNIIEPLN